MADISYEQNIANRLRFDESFIGKCGADVIEQLLDRVEELEGQADQVCDEFEGECWLALLRLLKDTGFDWNEADNGEVTADQAYEHISGVIRDANKAMRNALQWFEDHRIELQKVGDGVIPQWVSDGWVSVGGAKCGPKQES